MKICDYEWFTLDVIPNEGTASDAASVEFDPAKAVLYHTSALRIAYEALVDEFGAFEKVGGEVNDNNCYMQFKDGSQINIEMLMK